jgi:uncharacterized protein with gpF-like domain
LKNDRIRRKKTDRARQLQINDQTTQDDVLKTQNALQKEIIRRETYLRELRMKSQERLRQSSELFFEFFESFAIDLIVLSANEKSSIDSLEESRMSDVLIRSSRNAFISKSSFLQNVDVDSFID